MNKYYYVDEKIRNRIIISEESFKGGDFTKKFASEDHYHLYTHAFGDPEERRGVWCLNHPVEISFVLKNSPEISSRFFLKIVAMLEKWKEYVCPLIIEINNHQMFKGELFVENVCKGWASIYLPVPNDKLLKCKNTIRITNESKTMHVIINRIEIIEREPYKNQTPDLKIISQSKYKVPMYVGVDTDDVRMEDEIGEVKHVLRLLAETEMGNFILFRSRPKRNHFQPASSSTWKDWIEYCERNKIYFRINEWPFPGNPFSPEYIKSKKCFQCIHIIESYCIFQGILNPAIYEHPLYYDPSQKKDRSTFERLKESKDIKETKEAYVHHLKVGVKQYREDGFSISYCDPSLLACYLPLEQGDVLEAEPVTNVSLLYGMVRAVSKWKKVPWGTKIAADAYLGFPHDKLGSRRFKLMVNLSYTHGASLVNGENGIMKTNFYERFDEEDKFCVDNRQILRDFYRYSRIHERTGNVLSPLGAIYGNLEFMLWYPDDRLPELKDTNDWDLSFWAKWKDVKHYWCWRALDAWIPPLPIDEFKDNPSMLKLFSATTFGQVDVVPAEVDLKLMKKYKCLVLLGWNTMTNELYDKLKEYVRNGGVLYLSGCHLDIRVSPDEKVQIINDGKVQDLIGAQITGEGGKVKEFEFQGKKYCPKEELPSTCKLKIFSAKTLVTDADGNPVILENTLGKGKVYFGNFLNFPYQQELIKFNKEFLKFLAAKTCDTFIENAETINYALWEEGKCRRIYLVNVDWKKAENKKNIFINLWDKKYPVTVIEGTIREVLFNEDIAISPLRDNIFIRSIEKIKKAEYKIEVIGDGESLVELFCNGMRVEKIKQNNKEVKVKKDKNKYQFRLQVKGKEALIVYTE